MVNAHVANLVASTVAAECLPTLGCSLLELPVILASIAHTLPVRHWWHCLWEFTLLSAVSANHGPPLYSTIVQLQFAAHSVAIPLYL
jgi:hypothetical protein